MKEKRCDKFQAKPTQANQIKVNENAYIKRAKIPKMCGFK